MRPRPLLFAAALAATALPALLGGCEGNTEVEANTAALPEGHVGPETCRGCHAQEYADWTQSHHFRAMMPATDSTVLGDFNDATFTADGVTSRFFRREGKYIIRTEGADGSQQDFEVKYTFGFTPLQQYLVEAPGGRMQVPRVSWDTEQGRWFHQYAGERIPHGDWLHWTGGAQNWNAMCATCHSTDLQRGYDEATDSYTTTWEHVTVSCESCHGPGAAHVAWVQGEAYRQGERAEGSHLLAGKGLDNERLAATCVRCHARRSEVSEIPLASLEVLDNYIPALPMPELYHADGQILDEVYVYGSFTQSLMYRRDVKCTDCHQPHTNALRFDGNALCRQCHEPEYDSEAHTFHAAGTEASLCTSCHMPTRTYMGNDVRHDHSFRVPRPDLSVEYGTPNACTACHTDQSDAWAAKAVERWYGPERPPHFADHLLPGSRPDPSAVDHLLALLGDTATPRIVQATALRYLSDLPEERSLEALRAGLQHPDAQVRHEALAGLVNFPPERWTTAAAKLLDDPVRAVRIQAASVLSAVPDQGLAQDRVPAFRTAYDELLKYLHYQADLSTGALMLADHYTRVGELDQAEHHYRRTLKMDRQANYARLQLARLYNAQGRNTEALAVLDEASKVDPENARIPYDKALLYAELDRMDDALAAFTEADRLKLESDRLYVNLSALHQQQGNSEAAVQALSRGLQRFPRSLDLLAEMTALLAREGRPREARTFLQRLRDLAPQDPRLMGLEDFVRRLEG